VTKGEEMGVTKDEEYEAGESEGKPDVRGRPLPSHHPIQKVNGSEWCRLDYRYRVQSGHSLNLISVVLRREFFDVNIT
jgi:hypothetical protein